MSARPVLLVGGTPLGEKPFGAFKIIFAAQPQRHAHILDVGIVGQVVFGKGLFLLNYLINNNTLRRNSASLTVSPFIKGNIVTRVLTSPL